MFKKSAQTEEPESRPRPVAASPRKAGTGQSILGRTLVFKGELSAEEDLVIEGRIEGSIQHHNKNLTIGPSGSIKANINAKIITVQGQVEGDLNGDEAVILKSTAKVNGNIRCSHVILEDGAQFNGQIDMPDKTKTPNVTSMGEHSLPKYSRSTAADPTVTMSKPQ